MQSGPYYYRAIQIYNDLRCYSGKSARQHALNYLVSANAADGAYTWLAVMLVEWTFSLKSKAIRVMRDRDFRSIMKRLIALQNHTNGPTQCQSPVAWLRRISYQQFPYQRRIESSEIGRQILLFGECGPAAKFEESFQKSTGISIRDFSVLYLGMVTHALTEKTPVIGPSWFSSLKPSLTPGATEKFLDLLTCRTPFSGPKHESGYYQQSQLFKQPLLLLEGRASGASHMYLHKSHLAMALSNFVYDKLRAENPNHFMGEFGDCFSQYVEQLLEYSGVRFLTEKSLKSSLQFSQSKIVDFVLSESSFTTLVEVKAIEASDTVKTTASGQTLGQRLRDTIFKAICQGRETASKTDLSKSAGLFLIIVTYKQLYLATGETIRDCVDPKFIEKIESESSGSELLPFENIFVFSIEEFERLAAAVSERKTTYFEFLLSIKKRQGSSPSRKFDISQHLEEEKFRAYPDILRDSWMSAFADVTQLLKPKSDPSA